MEPFYSPVTVISDTLTEGEYVEPRFRTSSATRSILWRSISKKFPEITDLAIVPVSIEQLDKFDFNNPKRVLLKDRIGVQLVIGNVKISKDKNIFANKIDDIARGIYDGIQAYE